MGRSRYAVSISEEMPLGCKVYEPTHPHFVTCTVLHWLPLFTRKESVQSVIDSLRFLQKKDHLKLYAYVILENHLHMVIQMNNHTHPINTFPL